MRTESPLYQVPAMGLDIVLSRQSRSTGRVRLMLGAAAALLIVQGTSAQLSYSSGQIVSPAYEGWQQNEDGSSSFVFGYMNSNWLEELDVPAGPDNNIEPGGPDQGQPTHFLPRRNRFIFTVRVPKDFGQKEMIWTLTTHGKTVKAYASLKTDYVLENIDLMSERGTLGAGTSSPEIRANKPPDLKIEGAKTRSVKAGQPLAIVARVTDDGVPRVRFRGNAGEPPPTARGSQNRPQDTAAASPFAAGPFADPAFSPPKQSTVGNSTGLHLSWFVYRGAGNVTFSPAQIKVWEDTRAGANSPWAPRWIAPAIPSDGKLTTDVTFDEPGTYVLRGRADDGGLWTDEDVTVTVTR